MEGRLLGLSLAVFIFFAILDSSAQSFYPSRYGKRDGKDGKLLRGSRYERRFDQSNDFFYGSRYGKRSRSETPPGEDHSLPTSLGHIDNGHLVTSSESVEDGSPPVGRGDRYGRSPDTEMIRSNRFYFGSRFGKRNMNPPGMKEEGPEMSEKEKNLMCRYSGLLNLYYCPEEVF